MTLNTTTKGLQALSLQTQKNPDCAFNSSVDSKWLQDYLDAGMTTFVGKELFLNKPILFTHPVQFINCRLIFQAAPTSVMHPASIAQASKRYVDTTILFLNEKFGYGYDSAGRCSYVKI